MKLFRTRVKTGGHSLGMPQCSSFLLDFHHDRNTLHARSEYGGSIQHLQDNLGGGVTAGLRFRPPKEYFKPFDRGRASTFNATQAREGIRYRTVQGAPHGKAKRVRGPVYCRTRYKSETKRVKWGWSLMLHEDLS